MKRYSKLADACTPSRERPRQRILQPERLRRNPDSWWLRLHERLRLRAVYRDARITSIYEGTTQLQVVAAIRHVTTGTYLNMMHEYESRPVNDKLQHIHEILVGLTTEYEHAVATVAGAKRSGLPRLHGTSPCRDGRRNHHELSPPRRRQPQRLVCPQRRGICQDDSRPTWQSTPSLSAASSPLSSAPTSLNKKAATNHRTAAIPPELNS